VKELFRVIAICTAVAGVLNACHQEDPEGEVSFDRINGFLISDQGEKFLATDQGLFSFDQSQGRYEFVQSQAHHAPVRDLAYSGTDQGKELWLATPSGACNYTAEGSVTEDNSPLHSNDVSRIHFDHFQNAFFAVPGGLSIRNNENWIWSTGMDSIYEKYDITDIATASDGYTYVTTNGGGVERFRSDVDGISGATVFETDWTKLLSNQINSVYIDDTIQVYATDCGAALHFSEFTKWDWLIYTTREGLVHDTVLSAVRDHSGSWWFGTAGGVSRLDGSIWTNYTYETDDLVSDRIKFMAVDPAGSVWAASDEGLSRYMNGRWISYPKNTQ
jgi:ligand-binding sensor domain-containing protein